MQPPAAAVSFVQRFSLEMIFRQGWCPVNLRKRSSTVTN